MTAIRLQSFRSLLDTGFVELRPLTILVGKNSSGKSSFLRFLPLLRQSVEARTTGPLQWYGEFVDFGGFEETHSTFSDDDEIRLGFRMTLGADDDRLGRFWYRRLEAFLGRSRSMGAIPCTVTLAIVPEPKDAAIARSRSVEIEAAGHSVCIEFDHPDKLSAVSVNGSESLEQVKERLWFMQGRLLPRIWSHSPRASGESPIPGWPRGPGPDPLAAAELMDVLRPLCHGNTLKERVAEAAMAIPFGTAEEMLDSLRGHRAPDRQWRESVERLDLGDPTFLKIRDLAVANRLGALLDLLDRRLAGLGRGVRYSGPVRATAQRYYRRQDLAVDEVDPEGGNLAVFLRSLSKTGQDDFKAWTKDQMDWQITTPLRGGHISLEIEDESGASHNLADVGFGYSQMLPVLAQLWSIRPPSSRRRRFPPGLLTSDPTLAIEQPELHLHPALQARLADTMSRVVSSARREGIGLTLVVETHSEAIVNRIGRRIADGKLDSDLASVLLFEPSRNGKGFSVRPAAFDSDGYLQNWPFGFFESG